MMHYAYLEVSIPTANVIAAADKWKPAGKKGTGTFFISVKSQLDKTEFTEGWK